MLRQRVVTAVVLLALLLPALFAANPWPFALLTLALIGAGAWEWGRLNGAGGAVAVMLAVLVVALGAAMLWIDPAPSRKALLWQAGAVLWLIGGAAALRFGPAGWARVPRLLRWAIGVALLAVGWAAIANARVAGLNFVLSVMCIVWAADIAAYFGGRAFGRRKLAPLVSPGKTWEGVWGGLAAVAVYAAALVPFARAAGYEGPFGPLAFVAWLALAVALAMLSVVGDLYESWLKRQAGVKDSGSLLPGHGGVLDRVDALLAAMPPAALAAHRFLAG